MQNLNNMIDKLICEDISNNVPDNDVAVLLSGGVDSISVALAAPVSYTPLTLPTSDLV